MFRAEGGIHVWCKVKGKFDEYHLLGESIQNGVAFVPGSVLGSKMNIYDLRLVERI